MSNRCTVCSVPCKTSCGHCKKVWYCSVDHQKSHRREHKEECFPAIEKENKEFGRYFVATRNIKPLEVIWTEEPVVIAPDTPDSLLREVPPMCLGCCIILPGTFQTEFPNCSLCKWPLCSPSCSEIHWHSFLECESFQLNKIKPLDFHQDRLIYLAIKILRIIILKRQNSKKWDKIISLKRNTDELETLKFENDGLPFDKVVSYFTDFICNRCNLNEDPQLIGKIIVICNRNSLKRRLKKVVPPGGICGSIIYEKRAKLVHSCGPNTVPIISNDRSKEIMYATTDIKPGDILTRAHEFEPVGMNFPGQVERRSALLENHVWCKCSVCIDPTERGTFYSAIKCQKKIGGGRCPGYFLPCVVTNRKTPIELQSQKWQCNSPSCKAQKSYFKLRKIIESIQNKVVALGDDNIEDKLDFIEELENETLHENHYLITKMRFSLLPYLLFYFGHICEEKNKNPAILLYAADKLKTYALKCLEISEKFHPGSTPLRGVLLFFVVAENSLRVKHNISNPQSTEKMERFRAEALSILKLLTEGTYGSYLYKQLQTEILIDRVYLNGAQYEDL